VSKLCCPICWDLLAILRGHTSEFEVQGHHSTLYTVELPHWLPINILQELVARFKETLHIELTRLMDAANWTADKHPTTAMSKHRHGHTLSVESGSSLSDISEE